MRVGRIPYINCYPVYGGVDRGLVPLDATLVDGVPTALNRMMASGELDVSVVSAVEYARDAERYLLLPELAISCDGPVRSVMLFSTVPAEQLGGQRVLVSRSSMTSVHLLELLFEHVWKVAPEFVPGDAEADAVAAGAAADVAARLVIGDAALMLQSAEHPVARGHGRVYPHVYDLGAEWKRWTGLPFVFAVWVAQRTTPVEAALKVHAALIRSRDWGLAHLDELSAQASRNTGVSLPECREYFAGLDWRLTMPDLEGLTEFLRRLQLAGRVPKGKLAFLPAANSGR
ncbi:MAG: menaquinone biosynthesis protein [Gemmatimonadaceae bacterium]|nr:menaquinone biosynthesis protein [Gemmatimonadaceae bacterium]MCW5825143.1 menaquinone biosynthesis protein [Gemmatimonadaceae bacterium]